MICRNIHETREYTYNAGLEMGNSWDGFQTNNQSHLDEQERIQCKTFVNWINSYLCKRKPPMKVENLIEDLRDGVKLLALLEGVAVESS